GRPVDGVHLSFFEQLAVVLPVAGVAVEVLVRPELDRVDEVAHDHDVVLGAGRLHQPHVASVKRPHRGHEADRLPFVAPLPRRSQHGARLFNYYERTAIPRIGPLADPWREPIRWSCTRAPAPGTFRCA